MVIQIVKRTRVKMERRRIRYIFIVIAMAGTKGTPGALNFKLHLHEWKGRKVKH